MAESDRPPLPPAAAGIELLVLDVDGVMTDGGIYLGAGGFEMKRFDVADGAGIKYWQRVGKTTAIVTGRSSEAAAARAAELGIVLIRQGAKQKLPAYESILAETGLSDEQVAVMGDDLPDLPLMHRCGLSIAPANAVAEVLAAAGFRTRAAGGAGAVREAVEAVLKVQGLWETVLERYRRESP